ncbi:MAG: ATP-binding cassette domain-containing protein [Pseudomonadota bacterium]
MSEVLQFDLSVRKASFTLKASAEVPLTGITAVSGPSGSGKTTLLRALAGLESGARGQIRFAGQDWTRLPAARRGVGYVFQDAKLFPHLSVRDNLRYGAVRRRASQALFDAVIEALDLRPMLDRAPETLSGGEARRVALGRALASEPRVLLLDEPLTGLDRARKDALMPYIARAVAGFDVPALYVTHSAQEIAFLADRTMYIDAGRLTGWSGAAPRLIGQVINVAPGQINLALGDLSFWTPGQGHVGEVWALPLGRRYLLSTSDPGASSAALTLMGRVVEAAPGSGVCHIDMAGQRLALPWQRDDGIVPDAGTPVWLSLLHVSARPIQPDHAVDSSQA